MLKINYEKLLEDLGLTKTLKTILIDKANMKEKDADNFIKASINKHSYNIDNAISNINDFYHAQKNESMKDNNMNDIDQKLDEMINQVKNDYKKFEKENEIK